MTKMTTKRFPHYYENRGDVDVFAEYEVIAEPLPTRESRSFKRENGSGVTYASHSIKLAKANSIRKDNSQIVILMEHGGGREIVEFMGCYNFDMIEAILAMPERAQYSLLYGIACGAGEVRTEARNDGVKYALNAYSEKRIRKRSSQGTTRYSVESRDEQARRLQRAGKKIPNYA